MKRSDGFFFSFVLLVLFSTHFVQADSSIGSTGGDSLAGFFQEAARTGAAIAMVGLLERATYSKTACGLGILVLFSELQKQNPSFFNTVTSAIKAPWIFTRKKLELFFCSGESLSWNEIVTWRNRIMRLLSPLTKQTSVVDLSRDKRLRLIDQEDNQAVTVDEQWQQYSRHIEAQCDFLSLTLKKHLNYYETEQKKNKKVPCKCVACLADRYIAKPPVKVLEAAGKACLRVSIHRDKEIAFYLKELQTYLQETVEYSKGVKQFSEIDKEHVKRLMNSICDAFEHLANLIDVGTASSNGRAVGQLTMQRDGTTTNNYGSYGSYGNYGGYSGQ